MYGQSLQQMGYAGYGFGPPQPNYPGYAAQELSLAQQQMLAQQQRMMPVVPQQYAEVGNWDISALPQGQEYGAFTPFAQVYGAPQHYGHPRMGYWELGANGDQVPMILPPPQAPNMTMRQPQMLPGTRLTEKIPQNPRVLWLGFRALGILSGANAIVTSRPQDMFAPRKVVIPSTVAPNFEIADIRVGALSQLSSADPIPAEAFIPNASLTDVHFDTAQISQDVVFSVNNISNATAAFRASMNGFVVRA